MRDVRQESNPPKATIKEPVVARLFMESESAAGQENTIEILRLLWANRRFVLRLTACGLVASVLVAFVIPKRYTSTARLMPPDSGSGSGVAAVASMLSRGSLEGVGGSEGGLGEIAGDVLGMKSNSDIFVGILEVGLPKTV